MLIIPFFTPYFYGSLLFLLLFPFTFFRFYFFIFSNKKQQIYHVTGYSLKSTMRDATDLFTTYNSGSISGAILLSETGGSLEDEMYSKTEQFWIEIPCWESLRGVGTIFRHPVIPTSSLHFVCLHLKHRKWEPEGVHAWQIEGCNRYLRPKAAVANVYTHGKGVHT